MDSFLATQPEVARALQAAITELDLEQVPLSHFALVLDGIEHRGIETGDLGEHPRIVEVALAVVLENGPHLAWIGDNHLVIESDEEAADPGAVGAHLHDHQGIGVFLRKPTQALAVIRDVSLVNDLAGRSQRHADRVLRISKIDSDNVLGRRGYHGEAVYHVTLPQRSLPSHLLLFAVDWCQYWDEPFLTRSPHSESLG